MAPLLSMTQVTKRYVDGTSLSAADKAKIFEGNARKVFPRLKAHAHAGHAHAGSAV